MTSTMVVDCNSVAESFGLHNCSFFTLHCGCKYVSLFRSGRATMSARHFVWYLMDFASPSKFGPDMSAPTLAQPLQVVLQKTLK